MAVNTRNKIVTDNMFAYFDVSSKIQPPIRNLFTYTDNLNSPSQWVLTNGIINSNASIAPDGSNTAFRWISLSGDPNLVRITANNFGNIQSVSGGVVTLSIHVKAENNINTFQTGIYNFLQTLGSEPSFNVLNNFQPPVSVGANTKIISEPLSNNWYRLKFTTLLSNSISKFQNFFDIFGPLMTSGSSILIWGPQFEYGSDATTYQNNPSINGQNKIWRPVLSSNNNIQATLTKSVIYQPDFGGLYTFTDSTSNITISNCNFASTSGSSFTIGVWFKRNNLPPQQYSTIYVLGSGGITNARIWMILDDNNNGLLAINYYTTSGVMDKYITLSSNLNNTNWNYAVQVIDKDSLTMRGYLNGVLIGTTSISAQPNSYTSDNILKFNMSAPKSSSLSINNFHIYNKALTDIDVMQNYNALKARFNLI